MRENEEKRAAEGAKEKGDKVGQEAEREAEKAEKYKKFLAALDRAHEEDKKFWRDFSRSDKYLAVLNLEVARYLVYKGVIFGMIVKLNLIL